jgi:hypothetical protein
LDESVAAEGRPSPRHNAIKGNIVYLMPAANISLK